MGSVPSLVRARPGKGSRTVASTRTPPWRSKRRIQWVERPPHLVEVLATKSDLDLDEVPFDVWQIVQDRLRANSGEGTSPCEITWRQTPALHGRRWMLYNLECTFESAPGPREGLRPSRMHATTTPVS